MCMSVSIRGTNRKDKILGHADIQDVFVFRYFSMPEYCQGAEHTYV